MLKSTFIMLVLLTTNVAFANPISEGHNLNVTSIDKILQEEDGFTVSSTAWSPDGQYLLVTCSKSISQSNSIHKHYLLDINSHTFGEINYGAKEFSSYSIPKAEWAPLGNKIYFVVSRFAGPDGSGNCYIVCNPDGTNLRAVGTTFTDLSNIIENFGSIGFQRNLNWNPDSSKIVFGWQQPGDISTGVYLASKNGTNPLQLSSALSPQSVWYDSKKIFTTTNEGSVELINDSGYLTQAFQPVKKDEKYWDFSLSPDRKKILLVSGLPGSFDLQTYISNTDSSKLKGNISCYDGTDERILTKEFWQPNSSLLLVNSNGSLYIVEGDENNRCLLYEGNATEPQWFPDGKKILLIENKNKLYSINIDGTNLSFITDLGLTTRYFWNLYGAKKFSISPSGDIIAFTSALYPDTGKIIENEPDPSTRQNIAAPLFIINSDWSDLTQVTPLIKGRYDTFGKWSQNGKQFTVDSMIFSKDKSLDGGGSFLVELDARNSSPVWKSMPVKKILGNDESATIDKIQSNESDSTNTSQITEHKEKSKRSPSFLFLQLFACIVGIWLLHKSREP